MTHFHVNLTTATIIEQAESFQDTWREAIKAELNADHSNMNALMQNYITTNDCGSALMADKVAEHLNQAAGQQRYEAIDRGPHISPRHRVIEMPQVGDAVSYSFNGDTRPCGHIKSISATKKRITTTRGDIFYRVRQTGTWLRNGVWSLVPGHIEKRNMEF